MPDMLTADGRIVTLRPVRQADAAALTDLYSHATEQSLHLRFFSLGISQITDEVARLTRPGAADHYAVLAQDRGQVIGAASYERLEDPSTAEFAVLVADAWHGRGVAASIKHDAGTAVVRVPTTLSDTAIAAQDARERVPRREGK